MKACNSYKVTGSEDYKGNMCRTFDSLDQDGNSLITVDEVTELDIGWIMGDDGQLDREEWEGIKMDLNLC